MFRLLKGLDSQFCTWKSLPEVKAEAMLYALCLSFLLCLLSILGLRHTVQANKFQLRLFHGAHAIHNLRSTALLAFESGIGIRDSMEGILFESAADSFYVRTEPWGVYGLIHIQTRHKDAYRQASAIFGSRAEQYTGASLFLRDKQMPISLVGNTRIEGDAYLPDAGIRPGFVGGKTFEGDTLIAGRIHSSRFADPGIDAARVSELLLDIFSLLEKDRNGIRSHFNEIPGKYAFHSWEKAAVNYLDDTESLNSGSLFGKCRIFSPGLLRIGKECRLDHVCVFAQAIEIEEGFSGRVQLFARDSIAIGRQVALRYPSSIVVLNRGGGARSKIRISGQAVVEGTLMHIDPSRTVAGNSEIVNLFDEGSRLHGWALLEGETELRGWVEGFLYADQFVLNAAGGTYKNHLLDAGITRFSLPDPFLSGLVFGVSDRREIIAWQPIFDI